MKFITSEVDGLPVEVYQVFSSSRKKQIAVRSLVGLLIFSALGFGAWCIAAKPHNGQLRLLQVPSPAETGVRTFQSQMLLDAPPALVWQELTEYNDFDHYLPGYQKSTVISRQSGNKVLDLVVKPAPLVPSYHYQVRAIEQQSAQRIVFERISGDLKYLKAQYQLAPKGNGRQTLVTYTLQIDPGANLPGTNGVLKAHTEKTFYAFADHVDETVRKSLIGQR